MSITTDDFKAQVAKIRELREAESLAGAAKKQASEILEGEELKMMQMLEEAGLPNFKCEFGNVTLSHRTSVRIPREPVDLLKLKIFLDQRGDTDLIFTPNSAKLNSYFKEGFEEAKRLGKDDFFIPGCEGVVITPILSFRSV